MKPAIIESPRPDRVYKLSARGAYVQRLLRLRYHYRARASHRHDDVARARVLQLSCTGVNTFKVGYGVKIEYLAHFVNIRLNQEGLAFKRFGKKFSARVYNNVYAPAYL